MSRKNTHTTANESIDECELRSAERNRFFHGKLMTARDMETEQRYHRGLFTRRSRYVTGYGVLDGLDVEIDYDGGGEVDVTVTSGYAIDCCGRPVVVAKDTTETVELPSTSGEANLGVFIEYDECLTETVPIPGSEDACERECAYNRVIETFDLRIDSVEDSEAVHKPVPDVTFPSRDDLAGGSQIAVDEEGVEETIEEGREHLEKLREGEFEFEFENIELLIQSTERLIAFLASLLDGEVPDTDELRERRAELEEELGGGIQGPPTTQTEADLLVVVQKLRFIEEFVSMEATVPDELDPYDPALTSISRNWDVEPPVGCTTSSTDSVFLGYVSEGFDAVEPVRPLAYSNDLLYAAIARHTADFGNPHDVVSELNGMTGSLDLRSADDSIDITPNPASNRIDLRASGGAEEFGAYLRQQALLGACSTYRDLFDRIGRHEARTVYSQVSDLLESDFDDVIGNPTRFLEAVFENPELSLLAMQQLLRNRLDFFVGGQDQYATALERLAHVAESAASTEDAAIEAAIAQLHVNAAAECLDGTCTHFERFPPTERRVTLPISHEELVISAGDDGAPPRFERQPDSHDRIGLVFDNVRVGISPTRHVLAEVGGDWPELNIYLITRDSSGDVIEEHPIQSENGGSTYTFEIEQDIPISTLDFRGGDMAAGILRVCYR